LFIFQECLLQGADMNFKSNVISIITFIFVLYSSLSYGFSDQVDQLSPSQSPSPNQTSETQKGSLKACEKLLKSIKNYDKMRRNGGTARQMTHWKKKRAEKQKRFFSLKCTDYRSLKF
jgi:hypothetical protein